MNTVAFTETTPQKDRRVAVASAVSTGTPDLWWAALAATLIPVSLIWDFSWESTIGVDRFWSPPHLATNVGVGLGGLLGLRLALVFTLARHRDGNVAGVNIGWFCAPSGAWILLWGAAAMQMALIFDSWWQQAYGLGAGLWHPPQILKAVAFFTVLFGGLVLCAGTRSNDGAMKRAASALLVWHGGLLLVMCGQVIGITNYPNQQHTAWFHKISCAIYPAVLLMAGRSSSRQWGATLTALVYMAVVSAMVWLLPLFPARPLTAPIHNPTDHMMPPPFPLLLVLPALALDLLRTRFATNSQRDSLLAVVSGIIFVAVFVPAQWFFSKFLLSSAADNWFFAGGGQHWPFFLKIDEARFHFWGLKQDPVSWRTIMVACALAASSSWFGLRAGAWLSKLRR